MKTIIKNKRSYRTKLGCAGSYDQIGQSSSSRRKQADGEASDNSDDGSGSSDNNGDHMDEENSTDDAGATSAGTKRKATRSSRNGKGKQCKL